MKGGHNKGVKDHAASQALTTRVKHGALAHYDPQQGLKTIAVWEAAERHFSRAKDATRLGAAVEAKLEAQVEFVSWWDTQAIKDKGGGDTRSTRHRSATGAHTAGKNGIPDRRVIDRWRRHLSDPKKLEAAKRKVKERCAKIAEFQQTTGSVAGVNLPESNEWYTPERYIEAARTVLGAIDLDPASSPEANRVVKATRWFSAEENGLTQPWQGRVWMNPPYSGQAAAFVDRLVQALRVGEVSAAMLLVNSHGTDTRWFQPLWDGLLCFTDHRINFVAPTGGEEEAGSNHGSVFAYFGPNRDGFLAEFSRFGAVVERAR